MDTGVGLGVSVVMPYMCNGSRLNYLKKERSSLELNNGNEFDEVGLLLE